MTKPFAKAIAVVAFKLDPSVKASYRLAIASSALCTGLLLTSVADAAYILFGHAAFDRAIIDGQPLPTEPVGPGAARAGTAAP